MVLGEITSPWRGAGPPNSEMDKQGAWKADTEVVIQSHWRCLVEAIKWVDQEKQATPNIERFMIVQVYSSGILSSKQR